MNINCQTFQKHLQQCWIAGWNIFRIVLNWLICCYLVFMLCKEFLLLSLKNTATGISYVSCLITNWVSVTDTKYNWLVIGSNNGCLSEESIHFFNCKWDQTQHYFICNRDDENIIIEMVGEGKIVFKLLSTVYCSVIISVEAKLGLQKKWDVWLQQFYLYWACWLATCIVLHLVHQLFKWGIDCVFFFSICFVVLSQVSTDQFKLRQ